MEKKMKTTPAPAPDIGSALAGMGTAFMPDMGQATTMPPKIPSPILPPGQGPMKKPSGKISKRFMKKMSKPLPFNRKKASDAIASNGSQRAKASGGSKGSDKMSKTVDKEQVKQINDILPKKGKK